MQCLTGMLVYRDLTSRLASFLFLVMLMFWSLSSRSPECFMCAVLIVPSNGVRVLASLRAILCGALCRPDTMGH